MREWFKRQQIEFREFIAKEKEDAGGPTPFALIIILFVVLGPFLVIYLYTLYPLILSVRTLRDSKELGWKKAYQKHFHKAQFDKEETEKYRKQREIENAPLLPDGKWKKFMGKKDWPDAYVVDGIAVYAAGGRTLLYVDDRVEEFVVPEGVENIYHRCFSCCYSLKRVTLPKSLKRIGNRAFYACVSLKEIILPESVSFLGEEIFEDCTSLQSILLPSSTTEIPPRMFDNCRQLKEFGFPKDLKKISEEAFRNCRLLSSLTMNDSLEMVYERAFENCVSLEEFVMPETVRFARIGTFNGCHSLRKLHFSSQIRDFGGSCCRECWNLSEISMADDGSWATYAKKKWEEFADDYDPSISENPYPASKFWCMGEAMYFGIPRLSSVCLMVCFTKQDEFTIPDFVTSVKQEAFRSCRQLHTLKLSPHIILGDEAWGHERITFSFIYSHWPQIENIMFDESKGPARYAFGLMG